MGTADWGTWTNPTTKTASAQITNTEWNQLVGSGDFGYLVTGLQNTSLGHIHDGRDSRGGYRRVVSSYYNVEQDYNGAFGNGVSVSGWSALVNASAQGALRLAFSMSYFHQSGQWSFGCSVNGQAQQPTFKAHYAGGAGGYVAIGTFEWWTPLTSTGAFTAVGVLSGGDGTNSAHLGGRSILAEYFATG